MLDPVALTAYTTAIITLLQEIRRWFFPTKKSRKKKGVNKNEQLTPPAGQ